MEYSPSAWLGALAGAIVAVVVYVPAIRVLARHMREQAGPHLIISGLIIYRKNSNVIANTNLATIPKPSHIAHRKRIKCRTL